MNCGPPRSQRFFLTKPNAFTYDSNYPSKNNIRTTSQARPSLRRGTDSFHLVLFVVARLELAEKEREEEILEVPAVTSFVMRAKCKYVISY